MQKSSLDISPRYGPRFVKNINTSPIDPITKTVKRYVPRAAKNRQTFHVTTNLSKTVQIPCTSEPSKLKRMGFKIPPVVTEEDIDAFFSIGYRPPALIESEFKSLPDQAICAIRRSEIPIFRLPTIIQKKNQNLDTQRYIKCVKEIRYFSRWCSTYVAENSLPNC